LNITLLNFIGDVSDLLTLVPELQPFYKANLIDNIGSDDTDYEQQQSEFEDGEIIRIQDEGSKAVENEESNLSTLDI
jgi:hypothetical protein